MNQISSELQRFQRLRLLLKGCIDGGGDISVAGALHGLFLKSRLAASTYLGNHLVLLYSRCGQTPLARRVFEEIPQPNVFSYNALLAAYARGSQARAAGELFSHIPRPDLVSFNTLLAAYAADGNAAAALRLFRRMRALGVRADGFTLSSVVSSLRGVGGAAAAAAAPGIANLHAFVLSAGFAAFASVSNTLIGSYSRAGLLGEAERVFTDLGTFRDGVSWNCMIMGYGLHGDGPQALALFREMARGGHAVDMFTQASVLTAFTAARDLAGGAQFHAQLIKTACERNPHVGSGLVDLYAKCGRTADAEKVFDEVPEPDVVLWNTMISGYSLNDDFFEEALRCFREMQREGLRPDDGSFVCAASACSNLSSPSQGRQLHALALKSDFPRNRVSVGNALIAMYSKSGELEDAGRVFRRMPERNAVSFNSMIAGCAQHGRGEDGLALFGEMVAGGEEPTGVTFVSVLSACAHTGKVEEGWGYFNSMERKFKIERGEEHYSCMVDLLGRAGRLEEAQKLIETMPFSLGKAGWAALLGACRTHGNVGLGEKAAQALVQLEPSNASPYVVLASMYAGAGRWEEAAGVRRMMRDRAVRKSPGCSWIELRKRIHVFVADDASHPRTGEIRRFLAELLGKMKEAGYVPDTRRWAPAMGGDDAREGELRLSFHSEKLAVALGLLSTEDGTPILVVKNLRICGDCHSAIKLIAAMTRRRITVRDAHRFHHFREGECSCGDYW